MKKVGIVFLALLLIPAFVFAGGGRQSSSGGGGKTIVFVPKITGNAFFESANDGAQAHAKANGYMVQ
ncbi:MAG: hypothetical protein LBK63_14630, partial [Treponema sp.]|nr:hypothetical protein [Treponema sp.]